MKSQEKGMALPIVLLILVALTAFGHGALMLSLRELKATWAFRNLVRGGEAAEMGLRLAWELPPEPTEDRSPWVPRPLLSGETEEGHLYQVSRRWLNEEFFLLEATGGVRGWEGVREMAWLGWTLNPGARLRSFLGMLEVGGDVGPADDGNLLQEGFRDLPEGWSTLDCREYQSLIDSISLEGAPPGWARSPRESDGTMSRTDDVPSLGSLSGAEILRRIAGQGGTRNRTSTMDRVRRCPGSSKPMVLWGSSGDLTVREGRICGLVVTAGDLRMEGGAALQGIALVGGDLTLLDQARIEGAAKVGGSISIQKDALFRASACSTLRALAELPTLRTPVHLPIGSSIKGP